MTRPRRSARATDAFSQPPMSVSGGVACDGTALALLGAGSDADGGAGGDAELERAARADAPEEIDTEEDDAEFEERAHWGRRRASAKKTAAKTAKKKVPEEDKRQPKINMFCVVQAPKAGVNAAETAGEETGAASDETPAAAISEEEMRESEVQVQETEDDGNGGSSVVEVVVHTLSASQTHQVTNVAPIDVASPTNIQVTTSTMSTQEETQQALLSPTMLSGRPKRQAVLKAEHAQLQTSEETLFTTPPALQPTKKSSVSKATLDGEPDKKSSTAANGSSVSSSGRKRKLEMAGEKSKATQQTLTSAAAAKTPTKTRPKHAFFLTEEQKKQIIEIEAIETFKEQLREQRERDRAFYGNRDVKNPFFQMRTISSSSQKVIDVDAPEVIEVMDSPEPSPAKQRKSRWVKELSEFPAVQHVQHDKSDDDHHDRTAEDEGLSLPLKMRQHVSEEIVIEDDDGDEIMESRPMPTKLSPDGADAQIPFADMFWLLSSNPIHDTEDPVLASLSGELSRDEFIEKVSELNGMKEKHVARTFAALESARTKRQEKLLNLSLVDKYLPLQSAGMIGNKAPLKKLTAWLSAWKTGGSNDRDRSYDDSLFAFEGDDSEDDDDGTQLYRLFILEGEVGSGKSAAVYACAEELGYEIIEINAGQLRTGKAIVDIAGEATQSTRVLHGGGPINDKKSKKKSKSKKRRTDGEAAKPSHLSLVLFEDVDLIFEEDKGFLSTLGSIAKHSKCPIVVTCRHLPGNFPSAPPAIAERLLRPTTREFITWLSLVAHMEGIALTRGLASRLAELFACDIRRSLHFLQTYRQHIGVNALYRDASLEWRPMQQPVVALIGSDADAPISIANSQDDEPLCQHRVPAWSRSTLRPFDLLDSNLLPLLRGSACQSVHVEEVKSSWTQDEKLRHIESLDDLWATLDGLSLADEWVSVVSEDHRVNADDMDEGAVFFHAEALTQCALDVRMLSLASFMSRRARDPHVLSLQECPLADGVNRALQAARDERERAKKAVGLASLKSKLELPSIVKGSERVGARFCLDYLPLVSRILESSEPFQESRRRASRRNHYLGDVLLDMSAIDDIRAVDACFAPLHITGEGDEIVPLSASPPPAAAASSGDSNSISI